eukprot:6178679-Pleurochrysis_carterae.AAC.2
MRKLGGGEGRSRSRPIVRARGKAHRKSASNTDEAERTRKNNAEAVGWFEKQKEGDTPKTSRKHGEVERAFGRGTQAADSTEAAAAGKGVRLGRQLTNLALTALAERHAGIRAVHAAMPRRTLRFCQSPKATRTITSFSRRSRRIADLRTCNGG